ncbi:MAG: hypothetical protein USCAAHI_00875 [Beijerinckiaceae bacterium]|nr:MAG: hypothetical protein USCAAHI_00875 [Beijerinckiaceae bacterium]
MSTGEIALRSAVQSAARTAGTKIGQAILRGILGGHCGRVFTLFLWCWLAIINRSGRDIDHALCPLVQITRAFGLLLCHRFSMGHTSSFFQSGFQLPYSNWPTTVPSVVSQF